MNSLAPPWSQFPRVRRKSPDGPVSKGSRSYIFGDNEDLFVIIFFFKILGKKFSTLVICFSILKLQITEYSLPSAHINFL